MLRARRGQKTVAACVRIAAPDGGRQKVIRMFGTMTEDLLALRDWLAAHEVTQVAMESTGVYWKAVYYMLEDALQWKKVVLRNKPNSENIEIRRDLAFSMGAASPSPGDPNCSSPRP